MKQFEKPLKFKQNKKGDIGDPNFFESEALKIGEHEIELEDQDSIHSPHNDSHFDLSIQNVQLSRLYHYKSYGEEPCVNSINNWIHDNILYWDMERGLPNFHLPESFFKQSQIEIIPKQVFQKQNSLYHANSLLSTQNSKQTKIKEDQDKNKDKRQQSTLPVQKVYESLNSTQISSIWKEGMFTVYYGYGDPETWEIRKWVYYGRKRCNKLLDDALKFSKFQFKQILYRIFTMETVKLIYYNLKNPLNNSETCQCGCFDLNMLEGIRVILGVPVHLLILLIGIPLFDVDNSKFKDQKLHLIQQRVEEELKKQDGIKYTDVTFIRHLIENKDLYLNSELNFSEDSEIMSIMKQIQEGNIDFNLREEEKQYAKIDFQAKLYDQIFPKVSKQLLTIPSMNSEILKSAENNYKSFISMHINQGLQFPNNRDYGQPEKVLKEIKEKNCKQQYNLGHLIFSQLKKGVSIFEQMKIVDKIKMISRRNQIDFMYFRPRIIREVGEQGQTIYKAQWTREVQIPTSFYFWKVVFFFVASYFMIHKFIHNCLYFALFSPCGIQAAFFPKKFATNFLVEPRTGKIIDDKDSMQDSATSIYRQIKQNARKNVQAFEKEPDHGLLGKSITRLCNRLENWVFRYFILGFILTNICLRLAYILIGLIALILVPLSLVLAPLYTFLCLFACLFCYDFTVPSKHQVWDLPIFAPIFDLLIWRIFGKGIGQILLCCIMMVFHLFFAIFLIIFGVLIYILRSGLDIIVIFFLYSCGRVPGGDSYLAWRISRSQQSKFLQMNSHLESTTGRKNTNYLQQYSSINNEATLSFYQLSNEQVHQLIDGEFEREALEQYKQQMIEKISQPGIKNDSKLKKLFGQLPFSFSNNKISQQYHLAAEKIKAELSSQVSKRKKELPNLTKKIPTLQFSYKRETVLALFYDVSQYILNKYAKNQFYASFMWSKFKIPQGEIQQLALQLLSLIFFEGKVPQNQVLDKLTLKDPQGKNNYLRQQVEEYLSSKFKSPTKFFETSSFITFSMFVEKILQRNSINQPLIQIKSDNFLELVDFMLLNVLKLDN